MRTMNDSGIEWIGKIPENWNEPPLKSRYSFGKGLSITKADLSDEGAQVISYGQIHSKDNNGVSTKEEIIRHIPWNHSNLTSTARTQPGDLIFADTSEDLQGCGNCVYINREDVYAGYHTLFLHPKAKNSGRYFAYLFVSDAWRAQIREKVTGVKLFSITQDILKSTVLLEPPVDEQERIVQFLDEKCKSIDNLIDQKEKSITLLKERRQSIIYEAVTKGLNPKASLKDSGSEWLGQIPERWNIYRLKFLLSHGKDAMKAGPFGSSLTASDMQGSDVKVFNQRSVLDNDFEEGDEYVSIEKGIELKGFMVNEGDILITTRGTIGKTAIVPIGKQGILHPCLIKMVIDESVFLKPLLCRIFNETNLLTEQLRLASNATTIDVIYTQNLLNLFIPVPPIDEQRQIEQHLEGRCSEIDKMISLNDSSIQKLKEYRQSLIYEAVTGKKEV